MSESTALAERSSQPTDIVVQAQDSSSLAPVQVDRDPYAGIAQTRFSDAQQVILTAECETIDLDILPTGEVYLSQIGYRRRLNKAFGSGGWAMRPLGKPTMSGNTLMQEWALYAESRFVASAWGEAEYQPKNARYSYATATEALKSNALMRCCKDLGIASECWDRRFTEKFKKEICVKVWRDKQGREKKGEYQWRRKDADKFYDEKGGKGAPPEDVDTETGEVHEPAAATKTPAPKANGSSGTAYIDGKQQKALIDASKAVGWSNDDRASWLKKQGYGEWAKIPAADYSLALAVMQGGTDARGAA